MERTRQLAVALVVVSVLCSGVLAYPSGAGTKACQTLTPLHPGTAAQTDLPPYQVTVSKTTYAAGDTISVTLETPCNKPFKGFLIQARDALNQSSAPIGSFSNTADSRYITDANCGGGTKTLTHTADTDKTSMELIWTAPTPSIQHIVFAVTFAQGFDTYWVKVYSPAIELTGNAIAVPARFPTIHSCATPPPAGASGMIAKDSECGASKSCFQECTGDQCSFIVSWKPNGNNIDFVLRGGVPSDNEKWIAVGFSDDAKMGSDTVIDCAVGGGQMQSSFSRNKGRSNQQVQLLSTAGVSIVNNVLTCVVSIPKNGNITVPGKKYTLFFANGKTKGGDTEKLVHSFNPLPTISSEVADLESSSQVIGGAAPTAVLVKTHGSLMITAWVLLAGFGLVVARYYKKLGGSRRWCSIHIWFQLHRLCMILTFCLSVAAFIIIFVDVGGYSQVGKGEGQKQFLQAHPILGIISTALVVCNPLMALARPHPDSPSRPYFNWAHWGVGTLAWIISIVTIFLGFEIEKSGVDPITKYILAAFVAYYLLLEIILEIHGCMQRPAQKQAPSTDDYEMKSANGKTPEVARHSTMQTAQTGAGVFRSVLLLAHGIILIAFLIAILYFVNKA